jgi:branched-chain amino acid transport system permease protein
MPYIVITAVLLVPLALKNDYILHILILSLLYALLGTSWNLLGSRGFTSLGHSVFLGLGAYTSTLLFLNFGISPWIGMWAGVVISVGASFLIGYPTLKLRGPYFTLATIAFAATLKHIFLNLKSITAGPIGLLLPILGHAPLQFQFVYKEWYYGVILFFLLIVLFVASKIEKSKTGIIFKAIGDDEDAAESLGVNSARVKLKIFALSAAIAAIGGTFYSQYVLYISPEGVMGLMPFSVTMVTVAIIGGTNHILGPVIGALIMIPIFEQVRVTFGYIGGLNILIQGLVLMITIWRFRQGVMGLIQPLVLRYKEIFRSGPLSFSKSSTANR